MYNVGNVAIKKFFDSGSPEAMKINHTERAIKNRKAVCKHLLVEEECFAHALSHELMPPDVKEINILKAVHVTKCL